MTLIHKTSEHPYAGRDDADARIEQFKAEVAALEAQGWVRTEDGIMIQQGPTDLPRGWFRLCCDVLTPDDSQTARLRRQRIGLRRAVP